MNETINMIESAGTIAIIIGFIIFGIIIALICAVFDIAKNTRETNKILKELEQKQEYMSNALYQIYTEIRKSNGNNQKQ